MEQGVGTLLRPSTTPGLHCRNSAQITMGSLKKRRKAKINKHKRRKKLRANRHKKRTWQK
jgi:hypothetical protein